MRYIMGVKEMAEVIATLVPAIVTIAAVLKSNSRVSSKLDLLTRDINRLIMYNENLPLEERVNAGERYIAAGGNGTGKVYYHQLVRQLETRDVN
jgi:hypothetical protein